MQHITLYHHAQKRLKIFNSSLHNPTVQPKVNAKPGHKSQTNGYLSVMLTFRAISGKQIQNPSIQVSATNERKVHENYHIRKIGCEKGLISLIINNTTYGWRLQSSVSLIHSCQSTKISFSKHGKTSSWVFMSWSTVYRIWWCHCKIVEIPLYDRFLTDCNSCSKRWRSR